MLSTSCFIDLKKHALKRQHKVGEFIGLCKYNVGRSIRNIRVSTADDITMSETMVYFRKSAVKDKVKGKMVESEAVQTKTKLQQEQERLNFEAAVRLQAKLEEEERVEADEELVQRLQAEEREKYTEAE
ncbi:hypothetical protein Tco_0886354 [Tanacetum coccineum]